MFRLFECCALSFFERFVLSFSLKIERFVSDSAEIWICGLYWFTDQRPAEIHDFWMSAYTEIDTVPNKVAQIQKAGYIPVATFILPENCWIEHYFAPQAKAEEIFRRKHAGSRIVEELIISNHHEAELYSKYKAYYGYAFFICKKGFSLRR